MHVGQVGHQAPDAGCDRDGTRKKAFEVDLIYLVEDRHHSLLNDFVLQRCDGQRELHLSTVSIWDGRRSVTRFIRFEVNVSKCSKRDASLASTR
jgi:hypothetical protein